MEKTQLMHRTVADLLDSPFRTTITLIGAGGTGSHIAHGLASMHQALVALGHNGLLVNVYDDDIVEPHNVGRQKYGYEDVKENKAMALVRRINRMYGLDWQSSAIRFQPQKEKHGHLGNILITAVDHNATRNTVHLAFRDGFARNNVRKVQEQHRALWETHYWIDCGNEKDFGQVILGAEKLPDCVEVLGHPYDETVENSPSCSAEASLRS